MIFICVWNYRTNRSGSACVWSCAARAQSRGPRRRALQVKHGAPQRERQPVQRTRSVRAASALPPHVHSLPNTSTPLTHCFARTFNCHFGIYYTFNLTQNLY